MPPAETVLTIAEAVRRVTEVYQEAQRKAERREAGPSSYPSIPGPPTLSLLHRGVTLTTFALQDRTPWQGSGCRSLLRQISTAVSRLLPQLSAKLPGG